MVRFKLFKWVWLYFWVVVEIMINHLCDKQDVTSLQVTHYVKCLGVSVNLCITQNVCLNISKRPIFNQVNPSATWMIHCLIRASFQAVVAFCSGWRREQVWRGWLRSVEKAENIRKFKLC